MNDAGPHASGPAVCYVKNDLPQAFAGLLHVQFVHLSTSATTTVGTAPVKLPPGAGATGFWCADGTPFDASKGASACATFDSLLTKAACSSDGSDCVMRVTITAAAPETLDAGALLADNLLPLAPPSDMKLADVNVTCTITGTESDPTIRVTSVGGVALYVWLSTLADGRFEDNGFLLLPSAPREISFIPFQHFDPQVLHASLRVEHLQQNMPAPQ